MKMFMEAEAHINRSTRKQKETRRREIVDSFFFLHCWHSIFDFLRAPLKKGSFILEGERFLEKCPFSPSSFLCYTTVCALWISGIHSRRLLAFVDLFRPL